jgi:RHS repeat-associated protein
MKGLYDPYGNLLSQSGPLSAANLYRFSSKEQHLNSGMYYYGYRFYEPSLQRWMNRDPLGEGPEESPARPTTAGHNETSSRRIVRSRARDSFNLYSFVREAPLGSVDPFGLITFDGCTLAQQDAMKKAFKDKCDKIDTDLFSCCMKASSIVYDLRQICKRDNLQVICHQEDSIWNHCSGRCAWTHLFRSIDGRPIIHMCPSGLNEDGCPDVGCTLSHEMTHVSNWFNNEPWAQKTEVCLGCPPTDLWPGGAPPLP